MTINYGDFHAMSAWWYVKMSYDDFHAMSAWWYVKMSYDAFHAVSAWWSVKMNYDGFHAEFLHDDMLYWIMMVSMLSFFMMT